MSIFAKAVIVSASVAAAFCATPVNAVSIIWGSGSFVSVQSDIVDFSGDTTFVSQAVASSAGIAQLTSSATPLPSITSNAVSTASGHATQAQGNLFYYLEVTGPSSILVNLGIFAQGVVFSMAGPTGGSSSHFFVGVDGNTILDVNSEQGNNNASFGTFTTISVLSNEAFQIQMLADARTQDASVTATTSLFSMFFSLDPNLESAGYSIIASEGVGNSLASTPLPAALPLFATGLGALGLLGWRRKRKATTLAV